MPFERLYIATQDPREGGGVASMVKFVYRIAEEAGYDACLVFNMLDRPSQVRLSKPWELVTSDKQNRIQKFTVDGMEAKGIPLIFPEIEPLHYVSNARQWQTATADGDCFFAVGGTNHVGIPFARMGYRFGSWTATPLWEDRTDRLADAPLIERVRDHLSKPVLSYLERKTFEKSTISLLLSEYTAERVTSTPDFTRACFEVVPFPIDTETFSPNRLSANTTKKSVPTVLFVGRLNDPRKNLTDLLDAFRTVSQHHPDCRLQLIGAEPDERLSAAVKRNGLTDSVDFIGRVPNENLPSYYREADLFVIPSAQEGLAIVGLEAMACGTPVVSTRCGGPEQYVREGETGYLVNVGDVDELASRMLSVLESTEERERMGRLARELVESEYAEAQIRRVFEQAFEELSAGEN